MADNDNKRYYWLKLKKNFFQQHQIKVLKSLPNGRLYALIYLELMAESTSHDGELRYSKLLPYDIITLSAVIDEDKDNVEKAIETLINLELVEILDDGTIYLREIEKLIGSETGSAIRKREYRESKKIEEGTLSQKSLLEYRDKSKEKRDKSIDNRTHFVKPTLDEVREYIGLRNTNVDADKFWNYYESNGWKVGRNSMKDWKACVRTWERNTGHTMQTNVHTNVVPNYDKEITYDTSNNKKLSDEELNELLNLRRN